MSDPPAKRPKMDEGSVNEVQGSSVSPKTVCDLATQNFKDVVGFGAFVDKTLFIKAFLEASDTIIVALAPSRFGKSTNMDMVKEFVTGNKDLFEKYQLKIWKEERKFFNEYCKENPVIYVDFKEVGLETKEELLESFSEIIVNAFNDHRYLINEVGGNYSWANEKLKAMDSIERFQKFWKGDNLSRNDVKIGLKKLSQCLNVYHKKPVYAFIDEYDAPVLKAILEASPEVLEKTIHLIREVMSHFLKGNKYVKRGLINASVRIAEVLSAGANNIQYYEFLSEPDFSPYFGFTDKEVNNLFERDEFVTLKDSEVQKWYNGYKLLHTEEYVIYSTYSILTYLTKSKKKNKPQFESYWVDSASTTYMKNLFAETEIRKRIENLIDGEAVQITSIKKFSKDDIFTLQRLIHQKLESVSVSQANLFLQYLAQHGYLNVVSTGNKTITLESPNKEIKELLREKCYSADLYRYKYRLRPENINKYVVALESSLQKRHKETFIEFAEAVSQLFNGAFMPKCEDEFHSILFTLAVNFTEFGVCSELSVQRTKRRGRPNHLDILVIWSDVGMILELKFDAKSSEEAHTQILTQGYATAFDNYKNVTVKILLGMHMTKERKVSLTYTVDNSAKQTVTSSDSLPSNK